MLESRGGDETDVDEALALLQILLQVLILIL